MEGFLLWTASSSSKARRRRRQAPPTTPSWWSSGRSSMCAFCLLLKSNVRKRRVRLSDPFFFPHLPHQGRRREDGLRPLASVPGSLRLEADVRVTHANCQDQQVPVSPGPEPDAQTLFLIVPIISNNVASIQRGLITPPVSFLLGILGLNAVA